MTICKLQCHYHSVTNADCHLVFKDWLNYKCPSSANITSYVDSVKACLESNDSNDILSDVMEYSDPWNEIPFTSLNGKYRSYPQHPANEFWKKVYHEKFGPCYTFDSSYWTK